MSQNRLQPEPQLNSKELRCFPSMDKGEAFSSGLDDLPCLSKNHWDFGRAV